MLPSSMTGEPLEINVAPNRLQDMTTEQFETVLSTLEYVAVLHNLVHEEALRMDILFRVLET